MGKRKTRPPVFKVRTLAAVAAFFGVSSTTIDRWRIRGMPRLSREYDLSKIAQWRLDRGDVADAERDAESDSLTARRRTIADVRKAEADAEIRETKRDVLNGTLVNRSVAAACLERAFAIVASRLQALPEELVATVDPLYRSDLMIDAEAKVRSALSEARREILALEWNAETVGTGTN